MIRADARPEQLRYEDRNLLPTDRAARMTASGDGKQIAFGWLCFHDAVKDFPQQKNIVSVWSVDPKRTALDGRAIARFGDRGDAEMMAPSSRCKPRTMRALFIAPVWPLQIAVLEITARH
jgi:hypothetical protein